MADRERRVEPLHRDHPERSSTGIAPSGHPLLDGVEPLPKGLDEVDRRVLDLGHRPDGRDRVKDALEGRRLERDDGDVGIDPTRDLVHLAIADRTDVAQLLGQDQVGRGCGEGLLIELVERRATVHRSCDAVVDVAR
jgi:hypothetical protein